VADNSPQSLADRPVVVFGGTFDPPHVGHMVVADELYCRFRPVAVVFMPAATPPHKVRERHAPAEARWHMVCRAVAGDGRFLASDLEVKRGGVSYTIDTIKALRAKGYGRIIVAVGADNLAEITTWKDWERLVEEVRLVAFTRPGSNLARAPAALAGKYETLSVTPIPVSSTMVRNRVRAGEPFRYLVPPGVFEYIVVTGLYR